MQQRLGESDKDYEARKKRVNRTRRSLPHSLRMGGGGGNVGRITNMAYTPLSQLPDGWYGFDLAQTPTGIINPSELIDGTTIYSIKFNTTTGEFIVSLGDLGNSQITGASVLILEYGNSSIALDWSETNTDYRGADVVLAASMATQAGEDTNFFLGAVPDLAIHYDFKEITYE